MSIKSLIEWTDATWNFLLGCDMVSTGCANCYAIRVCWRLQHSPNPKIAAAYAGLVRKTASGQLQWTGRVNLLEDKLALPLSWKKPLRIFVNSESDLFHESVPFEFIDRAFAMMALCPQHVFQILTKRPARMREYLSDASRLERIYAVWYSFSGSSPEVAAWPLPNVHLGVSAENQDAADERVSELLRTPAAVRFISAEPLLGAIDLLIDDECSDWACSQCGSRNVDTELHSADGAMWECRDCHRTELGEPDWTPLIHWVIAGGESGPKARPMNPAWVRSLRDQCTAAGVRFFFKQWGEWAPDTALQNIDDVMGVPHQYIGRQFIARVGKKRAGRLLDGREWNEMPDVAVSCGVR